MVKVKICGLKSFADIKMVNQLQPEYVGFVFASSKRQVRTNEVSSMVASLDPKIKTVGVFVDFSAERVAQIAEDCSLDILQFHGQETQAYCSLFTQAVWKAFPIEIPDDVHRLTHYHVDGYVVDTYHPQQVGGTGESFNWDLVAGVSKNLPLVLAGGLTSKNVRQAVEVVRPGIVDVSSGVETHGKKDRKKIAEFIMKVRNRDECS